MKEFFKFDNKNEKDFFINGGVDYSKLPFSLVSEYPRNLYSLGINSECNIAVFFLDTKLIMPMLITLSEIECSINMITTDIFNNINSKGVKGSEYLITDTPNIEIYNELYEMYFIGKKIFVYKMMIANQNRVVGEEKEYIFYTSGTTGINSKVYKTEKILLDEASGIIKSLNFTKDDKILCIAPPFHSYGQAFGCFAAALAGSWVKYMPSFTLPTHIISNLDKMKYTILITTPQYYEGIYRDLVKFDSLRYMISAGGRLSANLVSTGISINNVYGSTETGAMTIQRYENGGTCDCVGTEIYGVKISFGEEVGRNNGYSVRKMYVNTPYTATKIEYDNEQIEFTNNSLELKDVGYRDENGNINVCGRIDNIVNIAGEKVAIYEVEEAFKKLTFVDEVKVIKSIDDNLLEFMTAYVVLNKECEIAYIRKRISVYLNNSKIPKVIKILKKLRKTETGKIMNSQE